MVPVRQFGISWVLFRTITNLSRRLQTLQHFINHKRLNESSRPRNLKHRSIQLPKNALHWRKVKPTIFLYFYLYFTFFRCFLSPLQLQSLRNREVEPDHDKYKSDVFNLGMTILETADLAPPFYCYDFQKLEINLQKLEVIYFNIL